MTKRQPKGTPVGGQFAQGRKPSGSDLVEIDWCEETEANRRFAKLHEPPPGERGAVSEALDVGSAIAELELRRHQIEGVSGDYYDGRRSGLDDGIVALTHLRNVAVQRVTGELDELLREIESGEVASLFIADRERGAGLTDTDRIALKESQVDVKDWIIRHQRLVIESLQRVRELPRIQ